MSQSQLNVKSLLTARGTSRVPVLFINGHWPCHPTQYSNSLIQTSFLATLAFGFTELELNIIQYIYIQVYIYLHDDTCLEYVVNRI